MKFKIRKLYKNYDPFSVYDLFKNQNNISFLDSSKKDEKLSEYSFIGINPIVVMEYSNAQAFINGDKVKDCDPFKILEELIEENKIEYDSNIPFVSGFIGYFSYDINNKNKSKIPKCRFVLYENIIVFDIKNNYTYITAIGQENNLNTSIEKVEEKFKKYKLKEEIKKVRSLNKFYSNFDKDNYEEAIVKLKD